MTTYTATLTDAGGTPLDIATLELGVAGVLKVIEVLPSHETFVRELVERLAAMEGLDVDVPPPPDARQFSRYLRRVHHRDAEYAQALQKFLATYYDIALKAHADAAGASLSAGSAPARPQVEPAIFEAAEPQTEDIEHAATQIGAPDDAPPVHAAAGLAAPGGEVAKRPRLPLPALPADEPAPPPAQPSRFRS